MAANSTSLTVTARAVDKASGPLSDVSKAVKGLPGQFGQASAALSALGGASQQMGGQVAGAVGKLSSLASMVATGGPIGIGIAAVTAAVAVATKGWEIYNAASAAAESASRSLAGTFDAQRKSIEGIAQQIDQAERALRNFGKSATEANRDELALGMERTAKGAEELRRTIANLEVQNEFARKNAAKLVESEKANIVTKALFNKTVQDEITLREKQIEDLKQSLSNVEKINAEQTKAVDVLGQLNTKEEQAEKAKQRKAAATRGATKEQQEENKALREAIAAEEAYARKVGERLAANFSQASDYYTRQAELGEKNAKFLQEQEERDMQAARQANEQRIQMAQQYADAIVSNVGGALEDMISGSKDADDAFGDLFKNLGKMVLKQAATYLIAKGIEMAADRASATAKLAQDTSTAASGALSAHSNIPFVGIAIGLAAAAAIVGAILAFKKFAAGGVATGGVAGMDSVPALLTPGERVLTVGQTSALDTLLDAVTRATAGSGGGGERSGGSLTDARSMTVHVGAPDHGAPDDAAIYRYAVKLGRAIRDVQRDGMWAPAPAR